MKIRQGFVSNSSSTSFTFCFKGEGIKPLCDLILTKYSDQFTCDYDEYHCSALEVVRAIRGCFKSSRIELISVDEVIADNVAYLKRIKKDIKRAKVEPKISWPNEVDHYTNHMFEVEAKIEKMKSIKEKGLTTVLMVGFGDNHGEVCGGRVGNAMDYAGREIGIDNEDLVVFTEQNR